MLNWLHLKNFQIHKDSLLEFSPGINFIKGETHNGKSSIVRALRLIAFNDPLTDEYLHEGKTTTIKADIDGNTVTKIRSKSKNEYKVNNGPSLKAFRTKVPEEVSQVLNLTTQNFQEQKEPYFLIQNTPTERMSILDNIAGFEEIKNILSNANLEVHRISSGINALKERIEEHQEQLKDYKGVEEKYNQVESTLNNLELVKYYKNCIFEIENILEQLRNFKKKEAKLKRIISKKPVVAEFKKVRNKYWEIHSDRVGLITIQKDIIDVKRKISESQKVIEKKEAVQQAKDLIQRLTEIAKGKVLLNDLLKHDNKLQAAKKRAEDLKEQRKQLEAEVEVCPICKKPF